MSERRYSEQEVTEIFERATETQKVAVRPSSAGEGLTLAELQEIGRDVGLSPDLVAGAARSLESGGSSPRRTLVGLPIGVGRTVELERPLTEAEWQHLVVDVRETFDARGRLTEEGGFRQWTNGNLEVLLEPTPTGERLRMRTLKGSASGMMVTGGSLLAFAAILLADMLASGLEGRYVGLLMPLVIVAIGLGMLVPTVVGLPGWARLRESQMDAIGERAASMAESDAPRLGSGES